MKKNGIVFPMAFNPNGLYFQHLYT